MKQVVESGQIGEVGQIDAQKSYKLGERPAWMLRRSSFGGSIPYIGIHLVDLMRWLSGREFVEAASLQAHVGFPEYWQMENTTRSLFRLDNGRACSLHLSKSRSPARASHAQPPASRSGEPGQRRHLP